MIPLSVSEVAALAEAVPTGADRLRRRYVLRQHECFGLTVEWVDFLRRQVRVDGQINDQQDNGHDEQIAT